MKELEYPLDALFLLKKRRSLTRALKAETTPRIPVRIAILGGSTTDEVMHFLELFLLEKGIDPTFYQSEYLGYWEDIMFENPTLDQFAPQLIYVHTTHHNIKRLPKPDSSPQEIEDFFAQTKEHFTVFWDKIEEKYHCPVIQNNLEHLPQRLLGNQDVALPSGQSHFLGRLNQYFYEYRQQNPHFYIHDLQYLSAQFGLTRWHDRNVWFLYKYAMALEAIPHLAQSVSHIIGSLYGKNKKVLVLDLDHTLWGGVVGDDGAENLKLGSETSEGEGFLAFQSYLKSLQERGVLLTVASKNDLENALSGLEHPDSLLSPSDFAALKANWNPKDENIREISQELQLGMDSFVFVDDNPAERELVRQSIQEISVPTMEVCTQYIDVLDRSAYFEVTNLTLEDRQRHEMYQQNKERTALKVASHNYEDYLRSLEMKGHIGDFSPVYLERITQLTNKTNQFNLTTKRYNKEEITAISKDSRYIALCGRLEDCFGDNGLVSVVIGRKEETCLILDLWLMSCRVLKRNFEHGMLDRLVERCRTEKLTHLRGIYLPSAKNKMVEEMYPSMGFVEVHSPDQEKGVREWLLEVASYVPQNKVMKLQE